MAVSFKSGANDTADVNGSGGNIVLGAPSGIAADDYRAHILLQISGSGPPEVTGTGMTALDTLSDAPLFTTLAGKVAGGSEGTITHTTPGGDAVSAGRSLVLSGIDTAAPVSGTPLSGVTTTGSTPRTLPTITTTVDGCRIVYCIFPDDGAVALSMGQTLHDTDWNFGSGDRLYIYYEDQATAGTTTARQVTLASGSHAVAYWMFAIAPEPVAATTPGAPTDVQPDDAFGYGSEVGLSWSAPASDGGASITGYRIRRSTDDGDSWTTHTADTGTTSTSATLTGLTNGTRYLFEVAAINSEGVGTPTVSEWGCTPIAAATAQTPPSVTTQGSAPWQLDDIDGSNDDGDFDYRWTGAGVRIYIVDTGVRASHEQFDDITVESGYSVAATGATNDVVNHGTSVAALAAGNTYGVAKDAIIVPIKAFEDDHNTSIPYPTQANLLDVLDWIENNHPGGPAVVNCSFALGTTGSAQIDAAVAQIETMVDAGFVFVLSAGNESGASTLYEQPAGLPGVIVVGGINDPGSDWSGGSLGPEVDLFAPADTILSARGTGDTATGTSSGTSYSAPITSGVLAMWLEANPDLTPRQVKDLALCYSDKGVVGGTLLGSWNRKLNLNADIPAATPVATATGLVSAAELGKPTSVADSVSTATGLVSAGELGLPAATASSVATVTGLVASGALGRPTVTAASAATATGLVAQPVLGVPVAATTPAATATGLVSASELGRPDAVAASVATATGLTSAPALGVASATTTPAANSVGLVSAGELGQPAIVAASVATATGLTSAAALGVASATSTPAANSVGLVSAGELGRPTAAADSAATATGLTSPPTLGVASVSTGAAVVGLTSTSALGVASATAASAATATGLLGAALLGRPSVTSSGAATATGLTAAPVLGVASATAVPGAQPTGLVAAALLGRPTATAASLATATGLVAQPVLGLVTVFVPPEFTATVRVSAVEYRTHVQFVEHRTAVIGAQHRTEVTTL